MLFWTVSEYREPNRPPCHCDHIPGTSLEISKGTMAHKSKVRAFPLKGDRVSRIPLSTYSYVNIRSSGDSPLATLRQFRDYHLDYRRSKFLRVLNRCNILTCLQTLEHLTVIYSRTWRKNIQYRLRFVIKNKDTV